MLPHFLTFRVVSLVFFSSSTNVSAIMKAASSEQPRRTLATPRTFSSSTSRSTSTNSPLGNVLQSRLFLSVVKLLLMLLILLLLPKLVYGGGAGAGAGGSVSRKNRKRAEQEIRLLRTACMRDTCGAYLAEESVNCVLLCMSPACYEIVFGEEENHKDDETESTNGGQRHYSGPLEDGEIDLNRGKEYDDCIKHEFRTLQKSRRMHNLPASYRFPTAV